MKPLCQLVFVFCVGFYLSTWLGEWLALIVAGAFLFMVYCDLLGNKSR